MQARARRRFFAFSCDSLIPFTPRGVAVNVLEKISGKKTYAFSAALILLAVLDLSGLVPAETRTALYSTVGAAIAVALRLAVSKLPAETQAKIEHVRELAEQLQQERSKGIAQKVQQYRKDQRETSREHYGHPRVYLPLLLCLLSCCSVASAADVRIVGPSSVPAPGYPCDLFVQGTLPEGTRIAWDHFPKREGLPLVEPKEGGRVARLNTMAGSYKLIAAVSPPGDAPPVILYHDFDVPGAPYVPPQPPAPVPVPTPVPTPPAPLPPPQPIPDPVRPLPPPNPVLPQGEFGIAQATYDAVLQVESSNRKAEAACMAKKLNALIGSANTLTAQGVINAIGAAMNECLPAAWDGVRLKLIERIGELYKSGRLGSADKWRTLLQEALQGLNAAAA